VQKRDEAGVDTMHSLGLSASPASTFSMSAAAKIG
jgi:hypothetical protein